MRSYRVLCFLWITALLFFQPGGMQPASARPLAGCQTQTEIPPAECSALAALYNSTGGPYWSIQTDWLQTDTPGSWFGVTVTNGHVTQLSLSDNVLSGPLPPELGDLASLDTLLLSYNQLTGSIPAELGSLTNLLTLSLESNQFTGSIPAQLGNLTNLVGLDMAGNQLSGAIPAQLAALVNLTELDISSNQLSGSIPPELGSLTGLQNLDLSSNQLSGSIPPELGGLAVLQTLGLDSNQLSGSIPAQLGSLAGLGTLDLFSNQLNGGIPPELGSLTNLQTLDLHSNQLSGSVPTQLGSLANLTILSLRSNPLHGSIPLSFTALSQLLSLDFSETWVCEPHSDSFQTWKGTVIGWLSPGLCYSISGQIARAGSPLAGVTISASVPVSGASNEIAQSAQSAANGSYTLADLPPNSYTLTPALTGHFFIPFTRSVEITDANYTEQNFRAVWIAARIYVPVVQR